jgi:hypothetical protein
MSNVSLADLLNLSRTSEQNLYFAVLSQAILDYIRLPSMVSFNGTRILNQDWVSAEALIYGVHQRSLTFVVVDRQNNKHSTTFNKGEKYNGVYGNLFNILDGAEIDYENWKKIRLAIFKKAAEMEEDTEIPETKLPKQLTLLS